MKQMVYIRFFYCKGFIRVKELVPPRIKKFRDPDFQIEIWYCYGIYVLLITDVLFAKLSTRGWIRVGFEFVSCFIFKLPPYGWILICEDSLSTV